MEAANDEVYVNTANGDLYRRETGAWVLKGNLRGPANVLTVGTVTSGDSASATITGTTPAQTLNLVLPKGDTGAANSLAIGTVSGGTSAAATITGTAPSQTLNLTLPKGETGTQGPPNSLSIGSVSSGPSADATITGTSPSQTLNLVLPQGIQGETGPPIAAGAGAPSGPSSDGATLYLNVTNGDLYQFSGGSWSLVGNLRGIPGADGEVSAAMLAAAVDPKVDKTSNINRVYATDTSGNQTTMPYSSSATSSGSLVFRGANGATSVGVGSDSTHAVQKSQLDSGLAAKQDTSAKGQANGYASLDGGGKVPITQLPSSIMEYKGVWNTATNTPTLADGTGDIGDVYRVTTGGTRNLGSGDIEFTAGDYVIYNGTTWEKSDTTDSVASVASLTGVISAANLRTALSISNVDNTSDANKPVSSAQQTALNAKVSTTADGAKLYGTDGSGNQAALNYNVDAFEWTFPQRGPGGTVNVGTPTAPAHAATKGYVDSRIVVSSTAPSDTTAIWIDIS